MATTPFLFSFPSAGFKKRNLPPFFPSECRRRFSLSPVLLRFLSFISAAAAGPGPTGEGPAFGPRPIPFFLSVRRASSGSVGKRRFPPSLPDRATHNLEAEDPWRNWNSSRCLQEFSPFLIGENERRRLLCFRKQKRHSWACRWVSFRRSSQSPRAKLSLPLSSSSL